MSDRVEAVPMTEAEIAACTLLDELDARFTSPTQSAEAELVLSKVLAERDELAAIVRDFAQVPRFPMTQQTAAKLEDARRRARVWSEGQQQ